MLSAATAHISERFKAKAQWTALFSFTQKGHYGLLCLAIFFAACSALVQPAVSIFMGRYSDALAQFGGGLIDSSTLHDRAVVGVHAFIVLGCCTLITNTGMFATWAFFGEMQAKSVREELFRSLLEKDLEWFELRDSGTASLLTRLQTQIRDLQYGTSQPFGFVLQSLIEGFTAFIVAMCHGWKLALVILACLPLSATVLYLISCGTQTHIESQHRHLTEASQISNNAISNISLVKCFNTQAHETARYVTAIGEAAVHSLKQSRAVAAQIGAAGFLIFAMFMLGFWYGSKLVHDGDITAGKAITTIWATFMSVNAFQTLIPHIASLAKGHAAAMALRELLDTVHRGRRSHRRLDGVSPETCEGGIEVCQVSFAYPSRPSHHVLQGCTLQFPAGRTTFVVGRSGSGKSTLSTLLMRFYSSSSGAIFIDGHDIEDLDTSWLRNNITCVHQDSALFNETIRTNIALGHRYHKHVTPAQIQDCISLAALEDVIAETPFGMDSRVSVGGSALSGGQIQRVVIARARLRNTPILILDESTSALDHANRARVVQEIRRWRECLTTIIITHDLTQIGEEDFVYVLEDGKVSREGPRCRISHTLLAMSTTREASRAIPPIEGTRSSNDADEAEIARQHRRPPNLRWKKEGTTLRASFEQQLDTMDTGDDPPSPKDLLRTSRLTTLFGNGTSERIRSSYAVQRHTRMLEAVQWPSSVPPLPGAPNALQRASQDIEMRPMSLHPNLAARSSPQPILSGEPLRSPRLLEKSTIRYSARFGGSSFSKIEEVPSQMSLQVIYNTLLANLDRNHWVKLGVAFAAVCCRAALPAVFSFVVARMFETFYLQDNYRSKALKWTMVQLAVASIDGTAAFTGQYLLEAAARRWADRLRAEVMKRVLEQPMAWFEQDQHEASLLLSILDRDAEEMRTLLSRFAGLTINVVVMMTVAIIWSFASCWKLTLVGLSTTPVIYGLARGFDRVSNVWAARVNSAADSIGTVFVETFTDIRTVRSFTLESYFHRKYNRAIGAAFATGRSRALYTGGLFGLSESTINFAVALLLWYAARLLSTFDFDMVPVLTSAFLLIISSGQASAIFGIIPRVAEAADSATRLIRLAQLDSGDEGEQEGKETLGEHSNSTETAISFSQMFFAYPSRPLAPALRGLDLAITPGQCVAVVGRSGGGKSTIASLLVGLYQADANGVEGPPALTIFGRDIRSLDLASLRKTVVLVPQNPVVFPGTVWENICCGLEPHTRLTTNQNVNWAATQAAIHDFILSLPDQYDTVIGEGGLGVSGGQTQRIALARALVRRPKILVLDEATSALDSESAELIRSSLRSHVRTSMTRHPDDEMTIVIISHAREMMQFADKVIMLEEGRVAEEGSYEALMVGRGKLYQMLNGASSD